ncbi:MAG: thiamine phosphate synthase [Bacteroidota bacterium]|jgi:thiamine-phosphate diphosphorylase
MNLPRFQYITDCERLAETACKAGVRWIQGRVKNKSKEETKDILKKIHENCKKHNCIFVVNDFLEIALEIGADGVHLGKTDMSLIEAKELIASRKFILGGTANTQEDVIQLARLKVDYIGLGPFRFTNTKEKLSPILGLDGYKSILKSSSHLDYPPVYAIGGIVPDDSNDLLNSGVYGLAVSGFLTYSSDMKKSFSEFETQINSFCYAG